MLYVHRKSPIVKPVPIANGIIIKIGNKQSVVPLTTYLPITNNKFIKSIILGIRKQIMNN